MRSIIYLSAAVVLLLVQCVIFRPDHHAPHKKIPFDKSLFTSRCTLAIDLVKDDLAAWWTSDSITAEKSHRLDSTDTNWFVYNRDNERLVYYGRYDEISASYLPKYIFKFSADSVVTRQTDSLSDDAQRFARAIVFSSKRFQYIIESFMLDFKFNHYIRQNADQTFSIWYFPAGNDRYCAYGLEIQIQIDSSASAIVAEQINGNELKYFEIQKIPTAITLDNTFDHVPSVGNIFFVHLFGRYFGTVTINNSSSTSTAAISADGKACTWTHEATP